MVEEIEDIKATVNDVKGEISTLKSQVVGLDKELQRGKMEIASLRMKKECCVIM